MTTTVQGLGYELVDIERAGRGLLRVTIDRVPGRTYPGDAPGAVSAGGAAASVTVEDCEAVTRQLQYVLEVEGVDYARLEVSSPGLDRPLRTEADFARFAGQPARLTLKEPLGGRRHFAGRLQRGAAPAGGDGDGGGWELVFDDGRGPQVLAFALDELREARLEPVVDFKGRRAPAAAPAADAGGADGAGAVDGVAAPGAAGPRRLKAHGG